MTSHDHVAARLVPCPYCGAAMNEECSGADPCFARLDLIRTTPPIQLIDYRQLLEDLAADAT